MKKLYGRCCAVLLAALVILGVVSVFWGDNSGEKPEVSLKAILDGSYYEEYQEYFAASFPGRERMLSRYEKMEKFYDFGESEKDSE